MNDVHALVYPRGQIRGASRQIFCLQQWIDNNREGKQKSRVLFPTSFPGMGVVIQLGAVLPAVPY